MCLWADYHPDSFTVNQSHPYTCEFVWLHRCVVVCIWRTVQSPYWGPLWVASGLWEAWSGISSLKVYICWRVLVLLHGLLHMRKRNRRKACSPWATAEGKEQRLYDYKMCAWQCQNYCFLYCCLCFGERESKGSIHTQQKSMYVWMFYCGKVYFVCYCVDMFSNFFLSTIVLSLIPVGCVI